ncbi:MAG: sensor histidine kinase [Sphingomonadales bacterium]|jgi:two-component system NarL family sensor kinase
MLNSGDILLSEIFFLLLPGALMLGGTLLISYFYIKRYKRIFRRYKIRELEKIETERKRIANDLHDFVAGKLLKIKSELHDSLNNASEPLMHNYISQGISDLNRFHDDLRYLVEYIYPKELMSGNIKEGFLRLAAEMSTSATEIIMDIEFENQLAQQSMHQLYRLMQEKISNIAAHAKPPKIFISLFENTDDNEVLLSISYPIQHTGKNGTLKSGREGRGISTIRERLNLLKARVQTEYADGFYKENITFPIQQNK